MKKIGFFGGTFNPIHLGHLRMALEVYEKCELSALHFVPAYVPVHKSTPILDFASRIDLIKIAIEEYNLKDKFFISPHESLLSTASYSYFSLQKWQEGNETKPYFIVGLEDFIKLDTWHNAMDLPKLTNFIVVKRAQYTEEDFHNIIKTFWQESAVQIGTHKYLILGSSIEYIETSRLDISSTMIRKAVCENKNTTCLLPQWVDAYIRRNKNILDCWNEEFKEG